MDWEAIHHWYKIVMWIWVAVVFVFAIVVVKTNKTPQRSLTSVITGIMVAFMFGYMVVDMRARGSEWGEVGGVMLLCGFFTAIVTLGAMLTVRSRRRVSIAGRKKNEKPS